MSDDIYRKDNVDQTVDQTVEDNVENVEISEDSEVVQTPVLLNSSIEDQTPALEETTSNPTQYAIKRSRTQYERESRIATERANIQMKHHLSRTTSHKYDDTVFENMVTGLFDKHYQQGLADNMNECSGKKTRGLDKMDKLELYTNYINLLISAKTYVDEKKETSQKLQKQYDEIVEQDQYNQDELETYISDLDEAENQIAKLKDANNIYKKQLFEMENRHDGEKIICLFTCVIFGMYCYLFGAYGFWYMMRFQQRKFNQIVSYTNDSFGYTLSVIVSYIFIPVYDFIRDIVLIIGSYQ